MVAHVVGGIVLLRRQDEHERVLRKLVLHRPRPPDIIRRPLLPILYSSFPPWPYTFAAPVFTLSQPQLGALDSFDPLFNTPSLASLVLLQT